MKPMKDTGGKRPPKTRTKKMTIVKPVGDIRDWLNFRDKTARTSVPRGPLPLP